MQLFTPIYREIYCAVNKDAPIIDAIEEAVRYSKREQANVILCYTDNTGGNIKTINLVISGRENWRDLVEQFYKQKFSDQA